MQDASGIVHIVDDIPELAGHTGDLVLLHTLEGFLDAGSAARLVAAALLGDLVDDDHDDAAPAAGEEGAAAGDPAQQPVPDGRVVASFDIDQLYDYRARRPPLLFIEDHYEHYQAPRLVVRLQRDRRDRPYLVLTGPEPDIAWERFIEGVRAVIDRLGVTLTVGLGGVPMAVPHTRRITYTMHATRPELLPEHRSMFKGQLRIPGSAQAVLEVRLGEWGYDAAGLVAHVPHYLAQVDFPAAAVALINGVRSLVELDLVTNGLERAAEQSMTQITQQIGDNEEIAEVVRALEAQYDAFERASDASLLAEGSELPTGEELGAEFERFLAGLDRPDDRP
jgi:proteasome assembly chaperone (PAC2) family protein